LARAAILCHSGASVALAYLVMDQWDCDLYWIVFALGSALPATVELVVMVGVGGLRRGW